MENSQFVTNDLSFTAYLMMNGCTLIDAKKLGRSYKFVLDTHGKQATKLQVNFVNSEAVRFDAAVRDLKKIIFGVHNP